MGEAKEEDKEGLGEDKRGAEGATELRDEEAGGGEGEEANERLAKKSSMSESRALAEAVGICREGVARAGVDGSPAGT